MARIDRKKRTKASLEDRFEFIGDGVAPEDQAALRSALFEVEDRISGAEQCLTHLIHRADLAPVIDGPI